MATWARWKWRWDIMTRPSPCRLHVSWFCMHSIVLLCIVLRMLFCKLRKFLLCVRSRSRISSLFASPPFRLSTTTVRPQTVPVACSRLVAPSGLSRASRSHGPPSQTSPLSTPTWQRASLNWRSFTSCRNAPDRQSKLTCTMHHACRSLYLRTQLHPYTYLTSSPQCM